MDWTVGIGDVLTVLVLVIAAAGVYVALVRRVDGQSRDIKDLGEDKVDEKECIKRTIPLDAKVTWIIHALQTITREGVPLSNPEPPTLPPLPDLGNPLESPPDEK